MVYDIPKIKMKLKDKYNLNHESVNIWPELDCGKQEKILLKTHRNNYYYLDMQKDAISVFITIYKKTDGSKYDKEVERATFCLPSDRYQYITKEFIDNYIEIDKTISRVRQLKNEYGMYFKIV